MLTKGRFGETFRIDAEVITSATAASVTSKRYSMEKSNKACVLVNIGTTSTNFPGGTVATVQLQQAVNTTATLGNITGATAVIGSTAATIVSKASRAVIQLTTAATTADTLIVNGSTFAYSGSTAGSATALTFGSTIGSTAATGLANASTELLERINANCAGITATTLTTASLLLTLDDTASTSINITSTGAFTPLYQQAQACVEVKVADLDSTSAYIAAQVSSMSTILDCGIVCIRDMRYGPDSTARMNYTITT